MRRFWVSLLTVLIYGLAQMLPGFILRSNWLGHMSKIESTQFMIYTQVSLFILAAVIIILINLKVKNPTTLEASKKNLKIYCAMGIARFLYRYDLPSDCGFNFLCN